MIESWIEGAGFTESPVTIGWVAAVHQGPPKESWSSLWVQFRFPQTIAAVQPYC